MHKYHHMTFLIAEQLGALEQVRVMIHGGAAPGAYMTHQSDLHVQPLQICCVPPIVHQTKPFYMNAC